MKFSRIALGAACAVLISHSAYAASLTMLQFGSFETRAEAQKRLAEVTAKHATQLATLATTIREVKLPPDNLTVYRTQAGPVESRAAAQAICSQLASVGDECYIVQTAMVSAPEKPSTQVEAKSAVTLPPAPSTPDLARLEAAKAVDAVTPELPAAREVTATARDPLNRAALGNVTSTFADQPVPTVTPAPAEFAQDDAAAIQVNKALDAAVNDKSQGQASITNDAQTSAAPSRSFWSRINLFSTDEPVRAPVAKAPDTMAAPVESVAATALVATTATPVEPESAVSAPAEPEATPALVLPIPVVSAPKLQPTETKPSPTAALVVPAPTVQNVVATPTAPAAVPAPAAPAGVSLSRSPISLDKTPVILHAEPLPLPPPPAPLREQDRVELAAGIKPKLAAPEVIAVSPITAPVQGGLVQVEEAKRVPVTQAIVPPPVLPQPVPFARSSAAVLSPTATDGQKTIWAQIGPFGSEQAAIAYWGAYRQNHPDFPVVRVRATTPVQTASGSKSQSWLRVGPVANAGFVTSLCGGLAAEPGLRCGVVRDLGAASDIKTSKPSPASRYQH